MPKAKLEQPITLDLYHRMIEEGAFLDRRGAELLAGELHEPPPMGSRHAACVARLDWLLGAHLRHRAIVRVQSSVELDVLSEPQPDIAVVAWRDDFYAGAHPRPEDVLMLVEVSVTTYSFDHDRKLPLYAAAGIAETWIARPTDDRIEIYALPAGGRYRLTETRSRGETIAPRLLPETILAVSEILP